MCKANLSKVVKYLEQHLEEPKMLNEWNREINNTMTKPERLTMCELAFAFRLIDAKTNLNMERNNHVYCFIK